LTLLIIIVVCGFHSNLGTLTSEIHYFRNVIVHLSSRIS